MQLSTFVYIFRPHHAKALLRVRRCRPAGQRGALDGSRHPHRPLPAPCRSGKGSFSHMAASTSDPSSKTFKLFKQGTGSARASSKRRTTSKCWSCTSSPSQMPCSQVGPLQFRVPSPHHEAVITAQLHPRHCCVQGHCPSPCRGAYQVRDTKQQDSHSCYVTPHSPAPKEAPRSRRSCTTCDLQAT